MIEPILISLCSALAFALRGDGSGYRKWMWLITIFALVMAVSDNMRDAGLLMFVYVVCGTLPTHVLFSAVHGNMPGRDDGRWEFLVSIAGRITYLFPPRWSFWDLGMVYGFVRNSLALPAIILLGKPWMGLVLLQGLFLYMLRKTKNSVRIVEAIMGFLIMWGYL